MRDNLLIAGIYGGQVSAIYKTENDRKKIAVTDGHVDIVEFIDDSTIMINHKVQSITIAGNDSRADGLNDTQNNGAKGSGGWVEVSYLDKSWVYHTYYERNIVLEQQIGSFFASTLGAILGGALGDVVSNLLSLAQDMIYSSYNSANIVEVHVVEYLDTISSNPVLWYRRDICYGYAVVSGVSHYISTETKYFYIDLT